MSICSICNFDTKDGGVCIHINPSGMWCKACREVGMIHCSDPFNCTGMKPVFLPVRDYSVGPWKWFGIPLPKWLCKLVGLP